MQQTIVLLYAEVTVAIHSFDLKGVIHAYLLFLIIQIETTRGDMEKEKEDRLLFLSDI